MALNAQQVMHSDASACDYMASSLWLHDSSVATLQAAIFIPGETAMPDKPTSPPPEQHSNEEPCITQEESVPSDGKDKKGEQMMEELGRDKPGPPLSHVPANPV